MTNKKFLQGILILLFSFFVIGCATDVWKSAVISTKNIDWNKASEFIIDNKRVEGVDMCHVIILFPTKKNIFLDKAIDDALEKIPGAVVLTDVVIKYETIYVPFIYGKIGYYVEGNVLIDTKQGRENDK